MSEHDAHEPTHLSVEQISLLGDDTPLREPTNLELATFIGLNAAMWFAAQNAIDLADDIMAAQEEVIEAVKNANIASTNVARWWAGLIEKNEETSED